MIRSALFSLEFGREKIFSDQSLIAALDDASIGHALQMGARSLWARVSSYRQQELAIPDELLTSIFDLISRMSFRSAPYSVFAGASLGRIFSDVEDKIELLEPHHCVQLQKFHVKKQCEKLTLNPSARFFSKSVSVFVRSGTVSARYRRAEIKLSPKLIHFLQKCPEKIPLDLKNQLLGLGILMKPSIIKVGKSQFGLGRKSNPAFDQTLELWKPTEQAQLSVRSANTIVGGAGLLLDLFANRVRPDLAAWRMQIMSLFTQVYQDRKIPLLDVLAPESSIISLLCKPIEFTQPSLEFDTALADLIYQKRALETGILVLTKQDVGILQSKRIKSDIQGRSLCIVARQVKVEERSLFQVQSVSGPSAIRYMLRGLSLDQNLRNKVQQMVRAEQNLNPDLVLAEVLHSPDAAAIDAICPDSKLYSATIAVSVISENSRVQSYALRDLAVGYSKGKLCLYAGPGKTEICPVLPSLYSFWLDSHPAFILLGLIESQYGVGSVSWSWGSLRTFKFLPRIVFQNLILSPAIWRLTSQNVENIIACQSLDKTVLLLQEIGIPTVFSLQESDQHLRFDCSNARSMKSFMKRIRNKDRAIISEILECTDLVQSKGAGYQHDLLIPVVFKTEKCQEKVVKNSTVRAAKKKKSSSWTTVQLYMAEAAMDDFLCDSLTPFLEQVRSKNWFYLRYSDPHPHLRIRVKGRSDGQKLIGFSDLIFRKGHCVSFKVVTYEPEIDRYGGELGCRLFEEFSNIDSQMALQALRIFHKNNLSKDEFWVQAGLISAIEYFRLFKFSKEELQSFAAARGRTKLSETSSLSKEVAWIKRQLCDSHKEKVDQVLKELPRCYANRSNALAKTASEAKRNIESGLVRVSAEDYCRSLVHMSLNRLDLHLPRQSEAEIVKAASEILIWGSEPNAIGI